MVIWCEAEGFYRRKAGECESKEIYCKKCNIEVKKIKIKASSSIRRSGRGDLKTTWDVIKIICPKCSAIGKITENYEQEDITYYSNEERRVYRIK